MYKWELWDTNENFDNTNENFAMFSTKLGGFTFFFPLPQGSMMWLSEKPFQVGNRGTKPDPWLYFVCTWLYLIVLDD